MLLLSLVGDYLGFILWLQRCTITYPRLHFDTESIPWTLGQPLVYGGTPDIVALSGLHTLSPATGCHVNNYQHAPSHYLRLLLGIQSHDLFKLQPITLITITGYQCRPNWYWPWLCSWLSSSYRQEGWRGQGWRGQGWVLLRGLKLRMRETHLLGARGTCSRAKHQVGWGISWSGRQGCWWPKIALIIHVKESSIWPSSFKLAFLLSQCTKPLGSNH